MNDLSRYSEDHARQAGDYRWPIITTPYPCWCYITALVVEPDLWRGVEPTDAELAVVNSFHEEYMAYWYRPSAWLRDMQGSHTFDVDGGVNSRLLLKRGAGDWCYRKSSWQYGPAFVPTRQDPPSDLVTVLDRIHTIGDVASL